MKRIIYALSKSRKDVAADIEQGCRELILHLIKLWFFPYSKDVAKWRREVAEKLCSVDTFKGKHSLPSAKFILEHSWEVHQSHIPRYLELIELDYGCSQNSKSLDAMVDNMRKYFVLVADELAHNGVVPFRTLYNFLDLLGF